MAVGRIGDVLRRVGRRGAAAENEPEKVTVATEPAPSAAEVGTPKTPRKAAPRKATPRTAQAKAAAAAKSPVKTRAKAKASGQKAVTAVTDVETTPAKAAPRKAAARKAPAKKAASAGPAPAAGSDWTSAELADVRAELVADLERMTAEYEQSMRELTDLQQSSTDGAGDDQADAGAKTFDREQELSIAANRFDLLAQIQRAVERIDKGTYGYCESCGKPIPKARLQAFPMATLDVVCKQREERR